MNIIKLVFVCVFAMSSLLAETYNMEVVAVEAKIREYFSLCEKESLIVSPNLDAVFRALHLFKITRHLKDGAYPEGKIQELYDFYRDFCTEHTVHVPYASKLKEIKELLWAACMRILIADIWLLAALLKEKGEFNRAGSQENLNQFFVSIDNHLFQPEADYDRFVLNIQNILVDVTEFQRYFMYSSDSYKHLLELEYCLEFQIKLLG